MGPNEETWELRDHGELCAVYLLGFNHRNNFVNALAGAAPASDDSMTRHVAHLQMPMINATS